jgi:hypothetical protein
MSFPILADLEARENRQTQIGDRRLFANADRLSEKLQSASAIEARRLYDAIHSQTGHIAAIEADGRQWEKKVAAAEAAIETAIQKDATDARDGSIVTQATADCNAVKAALDTDLWRRRLLAAGESLRAVQSELRAHLTAHGPALVAELAAEANRVDNDLATARARARKLLDGPEQEAREITSALETILGRSDVNAAAIFEAHRQAAEPEQVEVDPVTA